MSRYITHCFLYDWTCYNTSYLSAYLRVVVCCCLYSNNECIYTEETNIFTIESLRRKNRGKREKQRKNNVKEKTSHLYNGNGFISMPHQQKSTLRCCNQTLKLPSQIKFCFVWFALFVQVFTLRRASEEPRGHATTIMTEVLLDAQCKGIINASQKKVLLQQIALHLS